MISLQSDLPLIVDPLLASGNPVQPIARRHLGDSFDHRLAIRWNNFVSTTDSRCIIACGYPDYSFRVVDTDSGMNSTTSISEDCCYFSTSSASRLRTW